jgi:uncharacterized protein (DUF58 family)
MTPVGSLRLPALARPTARGQTFLAVGVTTGLGSLALGQEGLLRVAVLLFVLPVIFSLALGRYQDRINLTRAVSHPRAAPGTTVRVELDLENRTRTATRILLAEEQIPEPLGTPPRFVLDRLPGRGHTRVHYTVSPTGRGRHLIGPLTLRMTDPFGMCEITRSFSASTPVIVPPRTWPLDLPPAAEGFGGDRIRGRSLISFGQDDATVREYRDGDDIRRLHWRSTARHGQLMVRQEDRPREPHGTLLLDSRPGAHHGTGPDSSFEWAVSAVASAALALARRRYRLRLLTGGEPPQDLTPTERTDAQAVLDRFAEVSWQESDSLVPVLREAARSPRSGLVLAVLGELSVDQATALARTVPRTCRRLAVILDERPRGPQPVSPPPGHTPTPAHILRAEGWTVTEANRHESVVTVWNRLLTRPRPSAAGAPGQAP